MINLHGGGATGSEQAALTGYSGVADSRGFVVVYPDAIDLSWADGLPMRSGRSSRPTVGSRASHA